MVSERIASPGKGLFKGIGTLFQQAKTGFDGQRWRSVLSICRSKCTARKVAHTSLDDQIVEHHQHPAVHALAKSELVFIRTIGQFSGTCNGRYVHRPAARWYTVELLVAAQVLQLGGDLSVARKRTFFFRSFL